MQQFGRSHRANQVHAPIYRLLYTDLGGENRFVSAVASRLESLGALTHGDRRGGPALADFSYQSDYGRVALESLYATCAGIAQPRILPEECNESSEDRVSIDDWFGEARWHLACVG